MADTPPLALVLNAPWFDLRVERGDRDSVSICQDGHAGIDTIVVNFASVPGLIVALQEVTRG